MTGLASRQGSLPWRIRMQLLFARVRVVEADADWSHVRLRLPLTWLSRNREGAVFGAYQAAVADPVAAIACIRHFPDYSVWTRSLSLDFEYPGSTDLELRFDFEPAIEARIRAELENRGRSTPVFEYGLYRSDGIRCTRIECRVAIRPRGYRKPD